jgi:hypothetical protein
MRQSLDYFQLCRNQLCHKDKPETGDNLYVVWAEFFNIKLGCFVVCSSALGSRPDNSAKSLNRQRHTCFLNENNLNIEKYMRQRLAKAIRGTWVGIHKPSYEHLTIIVRKRTYYHKIEKC